MTQELTSSSDLLLDVRGLKTNFRTNDGVVHAVDGVDFSVRPGKTLGIVGESGCGKSVTSLSVMRLLDRNGYIADGSIYFKGRNLLELSESEMRKVRGAQISMIFQEPMTSLNPVFTIGNQIVETLRTHRGMNTSESKERGVELLRLVGIPSPEKRMSDYPHNLSGGMRQRVMIAMALSTNPQLLIADEPTTALDVTIQAQILDLMRTLSADFNTAIMLITHDLGVVAEMAHDVAVMYTGQIVERGTVYQVLKEPLHPYTMGLLNSIPSSVQKGKRLNVIKGVVPSPSNLPKGCTFAPRCPFAMTICRTEEPKLVNVGNDRFVHCWLYQKADGRPSMPATRPNWNEASSRQNSEAATEATL
jgi:peptide/nickel transport system ATP-binding protein